MAACVNPLDDETPQLLLDEVSRRDLVVLPEQKEPAAASSIIQRQQ
jgi:hypothetical protein